MSKAFIPETASEQDDEDLYDEPDPLPIHVKNLMTPAGYEKLRTEQIWLSKVERPRITEIVSWAAGNGDRSENGDYIYNKKRLREIDRRLRYLLKRLESAEVVDPKRQQHLEQVFFGATVTYAHADGSSRTVKLVGIDEANLDEGKINWISPVGKALWKATIGDVLDLRGPSGVEKIEVIDVVYLVDESS